MNKEYLIPLGLGIVLAAFVIFVVSSVEGQREDWNEAFEEIKQKRLALDQKNFNEIESSENCDSMFISIMKHDNEWWEETKRQQAWDLYKESCMR